MHDGCKQQKRGVGSSLNKRESDEQWTTDDDKGRTSGARERGHEIQPPSRRPKGIHPPTPSAKHPNPQHTSLRRTYAIELVLHLVGFVVLGVDGADEAVF